MTKKLTVLILSVALGAILFVLSGGAQEELPPLLKEKLPVEIYYLVGGPEGEIFATVKYNGAMAAKAILGDRIDLKIFWGKWDPQLDASLFQQAMAAHPDGISVIGWDAVKPFIPEAVNQGVIVALQNVDLPQVREKYGLGYVGQNLYQSGYLLGKATVEHAALKPGDRALVWGLLSQPARGERTKGVIDALKEAGVVVDYIEISPEVNASPVQGIPVITAYLASHPDCKAVITDHGAMTATQEQYFKAAGLGPDEIFGAGFDLSPATAAAIKSGYTDLVLDQQPFLQGFLPIIQIYLTKLYGFSGLYIDTGGGLVDRSNIDLVASLAELGLR
ncbi:MAG: hypothetical protein DRG83_21625 [Deltaproteobacteria bacterium]|nr:MAG: hypothetical protein DRG83_21625 [Deltaproteobacteria bacterium]